MAVIPSITSRSVHAGLPEGERSDSRLREKARRVAPAGSRFGLRGLSGSVIRATRRIAVPACPLRATSRRRPTHAPECQRPIPSTTLDARRRRILTSCVLDLSASGCGCTVCSSLHDTVAGRPGVYCLCPRFAGHRYAARRPSSTWQAGPRLNMSASSPERRVPRNGQVSRSFMWSCRAWSLFPQIRAPAGGLSSMLLSLLNQRRSARVPRLRGGLDHDRSSLVGYLDTGLYASGGVRAAPRLLPVPVSLYVDVHVVVHAGIRPSCICVCGMDNEHRHRRKKHQTSRPRRSPVLKAEEARRRTATIAICGCLGGTHCCL
ncbi:hypothetical protein K466DRAFT_161453 [Polyporus arcularius HHB13444]|uniref:Uncharacterized protein n=1 Tax=Polyporus arcularius HHB13444 TaxID=1314778 RepID=A0A5C3PWK9_9APHY|nr:hypothetical protein K466DRAFT_161453 [Polyporus arcularius HHB13444]